MKRGASLALVALALGAGSPAVAVEAHVKPAAERALDQTQKPNVGGSAAGTTAASGPGSRPEANGPRIPEALKAQLRARLDARIDRDLVRIRSLRADAVALLTTFVGETPKESPEMPEALLRLGELRWESEREGYVERFKKWDTLPVDQRGPTPQLDFVPSRDLFGRVLRDYPQFDEYDLALYVDGFLASEQGKEDEALDRFDRILGGYPQSRFIPDAHMFKAEALFNQKYDYAGALREYEEVLKFKGNDLYGLALFKSAWCLWRLGNTDEAAKRFVSVFEVADGGRAGGTRVSAQQRKQLDELQSEALKYLVEVFTEDERNTARDVYAFLQKIGGDKFAGKVVRALAETFYDQAHYERGIEAYELLLKLEPTSREAGQWVLAIASGYSQIEDYPKLKATYERAIQGYAAGGPWSRTQADPANVAATTRKIEVQLRQDALALHARAQKDRTSRAEFDGASALYGIYLARFTSDPNAYQIHFYMAEIDFRHLGKDGEAATHYMAAAKGIPNADAQRDPLKTLRHDAIYNALAALERVRVAELEARKGKPGSQETPTDKQYAEALDVYAQLYPADPALPELFFRQGKLYYDYGVYDPAVKIWGSLLERFPSSPFAQGAGELILDSFNRAKNYENIETWARRLKTAHGFQTPAQQAKLETLIVQAVFKQGEQKGAAGDHAGAAVAYLRAAKEFSRDPRAAQACVNAELEAQKAGDVGTLKEAATLVTSGTYRDRPESPVGAWTAATTFQAMGLFGDAAELDEAMSQAGGRDHPGYQKYEHTKDAAYNAVVLREAIGEHDRAVQDGQRFLAAYGGEKEADEVVFQMGKAEQNAGRDKQAADLYRRYLGRAKNADHHVEGLLALAQIDGKLGDPRGADEALAGAVALGKHHARELGPDGKYAAAHARYLQGERVLERFDKIQIQGDVKQLSRRLKEKSELLKQASTVFLDTVSLGVAEWTTAALYQIGRTYESFAKALKEAPPPSGLSDADKEAYQQQIDEFVVPIEERSLDAYENGWKKATELGIYNQWTQKMRESLGRLNGELYPPMREIGFDVRSSGPQALPALLEAPRREGAGNAPATASAGPTTAPLPAPQPAPKAKGGRK
jgi:tetratricopeptide (TPR) repeat protein